MKLKFKVQPYQTNAVDAVVDCFAGQPMSKGLGYRIDPDKADQIQTSVFDEGFKNADIRLTDGQLLTNIQAVQKRQNLPLSQMLYLKKFSKSLRRHCIGILDYPPSSAARQPNLVASNPADIGKPGFLL